ncbi:MAG: hypothetical protein Q8Q85_00555 [Gemmatimonadales bacterium]|nr:hypothetical protein [Gemmatimonadales bacterium]
MDLTSLLGGVDAEKIAKPGDLALVARVRYTCPSCGAMVARLATHRQGLACVCATLARLAREAGLQECHAFAPTIPIALRVKLPTGYVKPIKATGAARYSAPRAFGMWWVPKWTIAAVLAGADKRTLRAMARAQGQTRVDMLDALRALVALAR